MTDTNTIIREAFEAQHDMVADEYRRAVVHLFNKLTEKHGDRIDRLGRSYCHDGQAWRQMVRPICERETDRPGAKITGINHKYLDRRAEQYARDAVEGIVVKMQKKLAGLTEAKVERVTSGGDCVISGKVGRDYVRVCQQRVLKCSSKGTLYNQWPALIYVNAKKVSEKQFKELTNGK